MEVYIQEKGSSLRKEKNHFLIETKINSNCISPEKVTSIIMEDSTSITLITYDIVSTKIRNRLIDKLFDYGFQRIQNSIFIGDISSKKIDKFVKNIEEIIKLREDSVYLFSICEEDFKNGIFLGKFIENKKYIDSEVIFF